MSATSWYVYALNDPRTTPHRTFYVGKGTGGRARSHCHGTGSTKRDHYIDQLRKEGSQFSITYLAADLTDAQALMLENKILVAFDEAGIGLTNTVISRVAQSSPDVRHVSFSENQARLATEGLAKLKGAILGFVANNPQGVTNAETAQYLKLQSDFGGKQKDYLTWSVLGLLFNEGRLVQRKKRYFIRT